MFKGQNVIQSIIFVIALGFAQDNQLTQEEIDAGWTLLFDGSFESWQDNFVDYERRNESTTSLTNNFDVQNGEIVLLNPGNPEVRTKKKFGNFVVTFDYSIDGNEGFMYRTTVCGSKTWESAVELAIDTRQDGAEIEPGAAYDLYPIPNNNFKQNQFNNLVVVAVEDSIEHWHNGEKMASFRYWSDDFIEHWNDSKWSSGNYPCYCRPYENGQISSEGYVKEGYFALQTDHGGLWHIKNWKVLEDPIIGCMKEGYEKYNADANFDYWREFDCGDSIITDINPRKKANNWYLVQAKKGHIMVKLRDKDREVDVSIHDVVGNEVEAREKVTAGNYSFKLKSGIYFVRMKTVGREITQRLFVY